MNYQDLAKLKAEYNSQTSAIESEALYNLVRSSGNGDVVEIGSASGGTTIVLIGAAASESKTVYSIDPYPTELEGNAIHYTPGLMSGLKAEFKKNILDKKYGNIIQYNQTTAECIDKIPNGLSVVFIDSLHELSFVQNEIKLLFPKIAIGGWLCVHDAQWQTGQISGTFEGALCNVNQWMQDNYKVDNIKGVDSMFVAQKL
jgi:cephalosporin hydroxylase